jgi:hypothetical protein
MAFPNAVRKLEIADRRKRVADMLLRGVSQTAIAAELQIDRKTVYSDRRTVLQQLTEEAKGSLREKRALDLAKLQRGEREAWEAWERSKRPRQRKNAKRVNADTTGARDETSVMEEGRDGNDKFLGRVESAVMSQAKLEGLLQEKVELTGQEKKPISVIEIRRCEPRPDIPEPKAPAKFEIPLPPVQNHPPTENTHAGETSGEKR